MEQICKFRPFPKQIPPWNDLKPILLLTGSAGGGKSRLAAEKIHGYCLEYPNARGLFARKTRESLANSCLLLLQRQVIGADPRVRWVSDKSRFEYVNGSLLASGGMNDEQQRESIRSMDLDIVWLEEANKLREEDFNEVLARMRGRATHWRQIMLTTNPDASTHWIRRRLIQNKEAAVYFSTAADNPANPPSYQEALDALTGMQRKRLRDGIWCQAEGAVYENFDPDLHVIPRFDIPQEWPRYISIDFGYTNPFVAQWWAVDGDGRAYLYREIYKTQTLVEKHAQRCQSLSAGERITAVIADPEDAEGRATFARYFMDTKPANKAIEAGIQIVSNRIAKQGDGKPRLFILRDSLVEVDKALAAKGKPTCTADEIPSYHWPEGKDGKPFKEVPDDIDNHGCDAMRYMMMHLDPVAVPFRRFS